MHQTEEAIDRARLVFAGLAPSAPTAPPLRDSSAHSALAKGMMATVPIMLAGTLTVTGAISPAHATPASERKPAKREDDPRLDRRAPPSPPSRRPRRPQNAVPTTYTVEAGDTVSRIAGRYGLVDGERARPQRPRLEVADLPRPGAQAHERHGRRPVTAPTPVAADRRPLHDRSRATPSARIAARFGVSTQAVLTANGLGWSSIIYPGQTIAIPGAALAAESRVIGDPGARPDRRRIRRSAVDARRVDARPPSSSRATSSRRATPSRRSRRSSASASRRSSTPTASTARASSSPAARLTIPGASPRVAGRLDASPRSTTEMAANAAHHHPGRPRARRLRPRHRHRPRRGDAGVQPAQPRLRRPRLARPVPAAPERGLGHRATSS